jgi:hypothetical protein
MKELTADVLTTKKIWEQDESKDDKFIGDGMWRSATWSTNTEHHVTGSLGLARRPGGFSDGNSILSPRSSDSGMQAKIVEYVLGGSPNAKDLDSRMRHLVIDDKDKKDVKKEVENGVVQNGLGDDVGPHNVISHHPQHSHPHQQQQQQQPHPLPHGPHTSHHPHLQDDKNQPVQLVPDEVHAHMMAAAAAHQGMNGHSMHHNMPANGPLDGFELPPMDPSSQAGGPQPHPVGYETPYGNPHMMHHQPPHNVLPYDQQQLYRNHNGNGANGNGAQMSMLSQQYLQQQQQLAAAGLPPGSAGYPMAPYVINPQEPYALIPAGKNSQLSSV